MAAINFTDCFAGGSNLGTGSCNNNPSKVVGVSFHRLNEVFTATELLNARTLFQAIFTDDTPSERGSFVPAFMSENQSEDVQRFTYPNGTSKVTRDVVNRFRMEHTLSKCVQDQLYRGYNDQQGNFGVLIWDAGGKVWGENVTDVNGTITGIKPIRLSEIYIEPLVWASEEEPTRYYFALEFANFQSLNVNASSVQLNFSLSDLEQVQNAYLSLIAFTNPTTGTFQVGIAACCGAENLVDAYPTLLNDPDAFVLTNRATGNAITIDSVTVVTVNEQKILLIDADAKDTYYPASGQSMVLTLASVSALAALGIEYYEAAQSIVITRP
ncbi:hypothetical protein VF04_35025 [Nostoc linckia z7]|uniref:Uncharacterized protein n=1 Tax=Nostoc linckia z7 TaxID=1628745 RepID=A0ABX4KJS8_NOSLI|nr:hypothetical protein [Nostoc linckia]PHJ53860.1 hypothetical protein VF02_37055 [Nostoc linckia z1]PHJ59276.1 hypothetical protein VF05_32300 [Nostoc linckia z3]PHJ63671.1 hypothetical protein VF03_30175 [Nostoc linckia z2]PHJ73867.1 hypothetical protein VF06_35715 [Nostoc linckia z4]PHJ87192.1 hypothetical protein VF04_35025 [Nostoc linckia z7]